MTSRFLPHLPRQHSPSQVGEDKTFCVRRSPRALCEPPPIRTGGTNDNLTALAVRKHADASPNAVRVERAQ